MIKFLVYLSLLISMLLCGCTISAKRFVGKAVQSENVIEITNNSQQFGTWQTFDLNLNYLLKKENNYIELEVSGQLGQHYQMMYFGVKGLRIYLYLLDDENRVLNSYAIPIFIRGTQDTFSFNSSFKISDDTQAFSFGYRGHVYEFDDQWYFYLLPW